MLTLSSERPEFSHSTLNPDGQPPSFPGQGAPLRLRPLNRRVHVFCVPCVIGFACIWALRPCGYRGTINQSAFSSSAGNSDRGSSNSGGSSSLGKNAESDRSCLVPCSEASCTRSHWDRGSPARRRDRGGPARSPVVHPKGEGTEVDPPGVTGTVVHPPGEGTEVEPPGVTGKRTA